MRDGQCHHKAADIQAALALAWLDHSVEWVKSVRILEEFGMRRVWWNAVRKKSALRSCMKKDRSCAREVHSIEEYLCDLKTK